MIKLDIKIPSEVDLMRAAMAEVEKQITRAAQSAAAPHGFVPVEYSSYESGRQPRCSRKNHSEVPNS